jgi:hypothetical protein
MHIEIYLQKRLYQSLELDQSGYNVTAILDQIQSDKEAGQLNWINWDQPLEFEVKYFK